MRMDVEPSESDELRAEVERLRAELARLEAANRQLALSEAGFRGIFETSAIGMAMVEKTGRLLLSNKAMQSMLQYDARELTQRTLRDLTHPDDVEATSRAIQDMVEHGRDAFRLEKRYVRKDGTTLWGSATVTRVLGEAGPLCSVLVIEDITERIEYARALQESTNRYRLLAGNTIKQEAILWSILDNIPAGVFWKDRHGIYLGCNQNLVRDAGGEALQDVVGKTDFELAWSREQAEFYQSCDRQVIETGEPMLHIEEMVGSPDGPPRPVLTNKVPLRDEHGQTVGVLGIYTDITQRKQLEEALRSRNEKLLELDRLKSGFISAVSHELRTPLTSIRGFTEFLQDDLAGELTEGQRAFVTQIEQACIRLKGLVEDLLDYAQLEAGAFRLTLHEADLSERIRQVVGSLQPQILDKRLGVTVDLPTEPLVLMVDGDRIAQVLANLLGNALKFTPPDGQVNLRAWPEAGGIRVEVSDTGPGIPEGKLAHLFERFFQVDPSNTRVTGGTGLGLSISKALVEAHGGTIGVTSRVEMGSTFWFTLPVQTSGRTRK